tara:strand:+ start:2245 stop:2442 length:198 start_codon:yes stop_codon:yes gene_type:complete
MFKVKVRVDVYRRNTSKTETFETMVDDMTYNKLTSTGSRDEVLSSWCNSMFPGADKVMLGQVEKI